MTYIYICNYFEINKSLPKYDFTKKIEFIY